MKTYYQLSYLIFLILMLSVDGKISAGANNDTTSSHYWSQLGTSYGSLVIPVWIPGYRGQFAIGDVEIEGETEGDNIFDQIFNSEYSLEFYLMGKAQYSWASWIAQIDFLGGEIGESISFKNKEGEIFYGSIRMTIPRIIAGYSLATWDNPATFISNLKISVYSGLRYLDLSISTKPLNQEESIKFSTSWWDPILGIRIPCNAFNSWQFDLSGDIGGFGIGSDFTWNIYLSGKYRVTNLIFFEFAWIFLDIKQNKMVKDIKFTYDVRLTGPAVGIGFIF